MRAPFAAIAASLSLALVACSPAGEQGGAAGAPASAELAPEFTLQDLEGRTVRLSDFRGKAVVIDFWATWCPPCLFQVPELNAFWKKHRDAGDVVVLGIAVDVEGAPVVAPWVAEQGVEYTIAIGDEGLARRFGAQGFPTLALVAPDGRLDSLHVGLVEVAQLEELVAPLRAAAGAAPQGAAGAAPQGAVGAPPRG
ncbi:MAG TPA: TlpA disulfide reductase family protein [Myxococcota bacterium]|nr:TlpA disulfide reductase family protein [Myxococcota bacterium]